MTKMTGRFETSQASRHLQQLCKHFGHKVEATCDQRTGAIAFPMAQVALEATPSALNVVMDGEGDEDLARARDVIESHLKRFAFREALERMEWSTA